MHTFALESVQEYFSKDWSAHFKNPHFDKLVVQEADRLFLDPGRLFLEKGRLFLDPGRLLMRDVYFLPFLQNFSGFPIA